ncbi:hypothetical protein [Helicobacter bilis]|uniref:hypothetical protein n=1 Tax=Helicobacter bilis TaxID=37372 RepID=UPI00051D733D|nr:hypothetical protein [Helicobacter bilis]TLE07333.1 hypothetical protein LS78_009850 [Helicobacter bilis]
MSNNKEQIKKLRDNAELAMAAYGYFDRLKYNDAQDEDSQKALEGFRKIKKDQTATIAHADILDITYKYYLNNNGKPKDSWYHNRLFDGDFSPLQAKRFFSRYDLLEHCPNTESGFSATLFGEKTKQKNTESKAIQYTSEYGYIDYILAIRGTESKFEQIKDIINDYYIGTNNDSNRKTASKKKESY